MKPFRLDIVSTYRAPLYGFAILWIVIYHATIDNVDFSFGIEQLLWFKGIMELGNAGVDVFLFLSGVCLFFSYAKKPTLHDFMKKRAVRLIVPLVVIDYGYWIIRCLVQDPDLGTAMAHFVLKATTLEFWFTGVASVWFVSLLIPLYACYPLIHAFLFESPRGNAAVRLVGLEALIIAVDLSLWAYVPDFYYMIEIAIGRIPVFVFGCFAGKYVYERRTLSWWTWIIVAAAAVTFVSLKPTDLIVVPWNRLFQALGGISLSYAICGIFAIFDRPGVPEKPAAMRFLSFVGGFSLELYLTHIALNQIYSFTPLYMEGALLPYLVVAAAAVFAAWGAREYAIEPVSTWMLSKEDGAHRDRAPRRRP